MPNPKKRRNMRTAAAWRCTHSYSVTMPEAGIGPLPCHGTLRWNGREREDTRGSRAISDDTITISKVCDAGA